MVWPVMKAASSLARKLTAPLPRQAARHGDHRALARDVVQAERHALEAALEPGAQNAARLVLRP